MGPFKRFLKQSQEKSSTQEQNLQSDFIDEVRNRAKAESKRKQYLEEIRKKAEEQQMQKPSTTENTIDEQKPEAERTADKQAQSDPEKEQKKVKKDWKFDWDGLAKKQDSEQRPAFKDFRSTEKQWNGSPFRAEQQPSKLEAHFLARKQLLDLANAEVDKYYGDQLRAQKEQLDLYESTGLGSNQTRYTQAGLPLPSVNPQYLEAKQKYSETKRKADELKNEILTAGNPDVFAASALSNLGLDGNIIKQQAARSKEAIDAYAAFKNSGGKYYQQEANVLGVHAYDETTRYIKSLNELDRLTSYMNTMGMPDDINQLPKDVKGALFKYAPQLADVENYRDFVRQFKLNDEELSTLAGKVYQEQQAKTSGVKNSISAQYAFDELQNQEVWNDILKAVQHPGGDIDDISILFKSYGQIPTSQAPGLQPILNPKEVREGLAQELRVSDATIDMLKRAQRYKEVSDWLQTTSAPKWVAEMGVGAMDFLRNAEDWATAGLVPLAKSLTVLDVANKVNEGKALNKSERDLLTSMAIEQEMNDQYGDYQNDAAYIIANSALESMPYMAEFVLTSGVVGALEGAGKVATKRLTKLALNRAEKFGIDVAKRDLLRSAVNFGNRFGRFAGDIAYANLLSNTVQGAKTARKVIDLHTGTVDYDVTGIEGTPIKINGFKDQVSWGKALYTIEGQQFAENMSEMFGEYSIMSRLRNSIPVPSRISNSRFLTNVKKWYERANGSNLWKNVDDFAHAAKWNGVGGEWYEEQVGTAMRHMMGVDDSGKNFFEDVFDVEQQVETLGSLGLSMFVMGLTGAGGYLYHHNRLNRSKNAGKKQLGKSWDNIQRTIATADDHNVAYVTDQIVNTLSNQKDKEAVINYYNKLMAFRGASLLDQKNREEHRDNRIARMIEQAKRESYFETYDERRRNLLEQDLEKARDVARQNVSTLFRMTPEQLDDNHPDILTFIQTTADNKDATQQDKERAAAYLAYMNLNASLDGLQQRKWDDITVKKQDVVDDINWHLTNQDGQVVTAKLGDDIVAIVRGDLKTNETVTIYNMSKRQFEKVNSSDIDEKTVDDPVDAAIYSIMMQQSVERDYQAKERANAVRTGLEVGSSYKFADGRELTVLGAARDGGLLYSIHEDGKEDVIQHSSPVDLKGLINNINDERVSTIYNKVLDNVTASLAANPFDFSSLTQEEEFAEEEETLGPITATSYKKLGSVQNTGDETKDKHAHLNNASKVLQVAEQATSVTDFATRLYAEQLYFNDEQANSVWKAFKAFKAGNLSKAQFSNIFIPEKYRSEDMQKQLDDIEIDWDGTVTHPKQIKIRQEQEAKELQDKLDGWLEELNSTTNIEDERQLKRDLEDALPIGFKLTKRGGVWQIIDTNKVAEDSPVKPAPESQGAVGETVQTVTITNEQQKAVDAIYDKIKSDNENVLIEQRTAHDYFVLVNGKRKMFSRVHSVLGSQREESPITEQLIQQHISYLRNAYAKGIKDFRIAAKRLTVGLVDIKDYLSYIEETPEDAELVFEAIGWLVENTNKPILKDEYRGKLIYVQDGGGKSTIKKYNPTVVDSDEILKQLAPDGFDRVPPERRKEVMDQYNARIRAEKRAGKTVLTANIQMLEEADVVIYNNSVTDTVNRTNAEERDNRFKAPTRAKEHLEKINKYLADNNSVESHKLSPGQYAADILTQRPTNPATEVGVIMDDIYRALFTKEDVSYVDFELSNGKRICDVMSEETFDHIKEAVAKRKEQYKGWTLVTEPVRVYGTFFDTKTNRLVRVCGETDMVAVNNKGDIQIIDFKTSKYDFGKGFETKQHGYKRSTKEQYGMQLTAYTLLAKQQLEAGTISLEVIPTTLKYTNDLHIESAQMRNNIPLEYHPDILSRFKEAGDIEEMKKIAEQQLRSVETEFSISTVGSVVSAKTQVLLDQLDQLVEDWKQQYDNATGVEHYIRLFKAYENLFAVRDMVFRQIEEDEDEYQKEELEYIQGPIGQTPTYVPEEELIESESEPEDTNVANLNAQFNQNREELSSICQLIQQNHWQDDPTQIPEETRRRMDQLMSNIDALIQTGQVQVDQAILNDYERAKNWINHTLSINGSVSTPQLPEQVDDNDFKKYTTLKKEDVANSVATDNPNLKLSDVANTPDFAKTATFVLSQKKEPGQKNPRLYVSVVYNGHAYTPIPIYTAHTKEGKAFYQRALTGLRFAKPGQVVIANVALRTKGDTKLAQNGESLLIKGLVTTKTNTDVPNIYDIEFTGSQRLFGVIRNDKTGHAVVAIPKKSGNNWDHVYGYTNAPGQNNTPTAGTVVYMGELHYDEFGNTTPRFPILINSRKIGEADAQFIIDMLDKQFVTDKKMSRVQMMNSHFIQNGDTGLTCAQVLSYLIPYGNENAKGHKFVYMEIDPQNDNIIHIKGRIDGDPAAVSEVKDRPFDISTDEGKEALKTFLQNEVNVHIDLKGFAGSRIGMDQTIRRLVTSRGRIQFGNSSIVFDKSDIQNPNVPSDKAGISGLGWYIKNGFLNTRYAGLEAPWIRFDERAGVSTINEGETKTTKVEQVGTQEHPELPEMEIPETSVSYLDEFGSLDKTVQHVRADINEKEARANLERIFGKNGVNTEFFDHVLAMTRSGWSVVGRCCYDAIELTRQAGRGDEYHEAFHRVVELFLTEKQRKKVYDEFRKAKNNPNMSDKEVREGLSDEFQFYAMNTPTFKLSWNIWNMFKTIRDWVKMLRQIGSWRLFKLYTLANHGKFANVTPTQEQLRHFAEITPLYLEVRNAKLKQVANEYQYKELVNSLAFMFLKPEIVAERWFNVDVTDIKVSKEALMSNSYWKSLIESDNTPQHVKDVLQEAADNFEDIAPDVVSYLTQFTTDYKQVFEEENDQNKEGAGDESREDDDTDPNSFEEIEAAQIEQHVRSSYEFHPFTRASQRVKWFFAGISQQKYNAQGKAVPVPNTLGLPQLLNPKEAYSKVLNSLHDIKSPQDFLDQCAELGKQDPMYAVIYNRFKPIFDGQIEDADKEGFVTQMWTAIKQSKNDFDTVLAKQIPGTDFYTFSIVSQDKEHLSKQYKENWSSNFLYGGCRFVTTDQNGNLIMRTRQDGKQWPVTIFNSLFERISAYSELFSAKENKQPTVVNGRTLDENNPGDVQFVKDNLIEILNSVGISFTGEMLDRMLLKRYGNIGKEGLAELFSDDKISILDFFKSLNGIYNLNTRQLETTPATIRSIFNNRGFIKELADQKYAYEHERDQLMVLAVGGNRFYIMSENNLITDRLEELTNSEYLARLAQYEYNLIDEDGVKMGSIAMKHAMQGGQSLKFHTLVGFKSDSRGDTGIDYAEISSREDYIAKAAILANGHILLPTMSDKKTFGYVAGLVLPGLRYGERKVAATSGAIDNRLIQMSNGAIEALVDDDVVDQFIEYAACEHRAIRTFLDSAPIHEVKNFHKGQTVTDATDTTYTIMQGGRYNFMLGVYDGDEFVEFNTILDEAGKYTSEEAMYNKAEEYFFSKTLDEQRAMIRRIITEATKKELKHLEDIGLVKKVEGTNDPMQAYENAGLDQLAITAIYNTLLEGVDQSKMRIADFDNVRRRAVSTYVTDIVAKHIMSMQECTRVFSGNPAFFKHSYDKKGHLIDITTDMQKRLGGLVSTGTNNNTFIHGIPKQYTCAEIKDVEIVSEDIKELGEKIYESELRYSYHQQLLSEAKVTFDSDPEILARIKDDVYGEPKEEVEKKVGETTLAVVKEKARQKTAALEDVNVADGASYVSDKMCENLLREVGSWNKDIEAAFKILRAEPIDGKTYTTEEIMSQTEAYQKVLTTVIGTQKYTAYGYRFQGGVAIPYYNKTALFPLFKCIATGKMAVIYDAMLKQGVDMVMMDSAVKVGSQEAQKFDDIVNGKAFAKYKQEYKYLRKQFNTDPKEKDLMSMGTQMTKVALQSLMPGLTYKVGVKEYTATEIRDNIMECMRKLSEIGKQQIEEKFFTDGKLDVDKLSDLLTEELASRGASREQLAAVQSVTEKDGSVNLRIPLDAQASSNWIQSIINSIINKEVIDTNTEGKAFYQRSVLGMEGGQILDDSNMAKSINNENNLKVQNENGSMDCVLSIDFFNRVLKRAGLEKASFDKQKQWLIDNGIISGVRTGETEWSNASANLIGYRIPTQATSSIHALRCVDVLPVVRDTVILPKEFTAITGSDFDIDKIFISSIQYNVVNGKVSSYDTESVEYIRNELIRNYLAVLCATDNAMHLLNGSIDKDTKLLTDIRDLLESENKKPTLTSFTSFTLSSQSQSKMDFIMGKFGIGPFALNNNSHILTMLYGVEFADNPGILKRLGKTSLHETVDDDGNSIMSWLSGLINAHVDVARDPYIGRLGVNTYTYNLVNLLIRTGFGKKTFFFTTQPVMKQFATAYSVASGVYMQDKTISKSKRQKEAIQSAWLKMLKDKYGYEYKTIKEGRSKFREYFTMMYGVETDDAIDALMSKNNDVLQRISVSGVESILDDSNWEFEVNGKKIAPTTFEIQMLVAEANEQFRPYAEKLADLVKYAKIDTKKQGKNITQQRMYEAGFNSIFKSKAFKQTGLSRMRSMSYINAKTENALTLFRDIIGSQVIEGTDSFWEMTTSILEIIGKKGVQDEKIVKSVMNAVKSKIKSGYFFGNGGYCDRHGIDPKSLVSGDNTIYDRLQKIQAKILGDPAYAEYREKGGVPKNYLLKNLVSASVWEAPVNQYDEKTKKWSLGKGTASDAYKNAKFVRPLNFLSDDPVEQDLFTQGWYELLNDNGFPEGQEFARDLIVYAFMTSGANGGKFDLFKYVPNEWKENIDGVFEDSFTYYMQQQLDDWKAGKSLSDADIKDILISNWFDDNLVPTYKMVDANGHLNFTAIRTDDKNGYPLVLAAVSRSEKRDYVKIRPKEAPAFIKIQRNETTVIGQRNYVIYRFSGIYSTARGHNGEMIDFPVYTAVDPKGTRYPSFETIYEYGWSAADSSETKDAVLKLLSDFLESQGMLTKPYIDFALSGNSNIVKAVLDFIRDHQELEDRYKLLKIDPLLEYLAEGIEQKPVEAEVAIEPEDTVEQPQPAPNTYAPGTQPQSNISIGPETKINIYAGTGENADLSNFAERPFVIPEGFDISVPSRRDISHGTIGMNNDGSDTKYRSVEAAFQGIKATYSETGYPANTDFEELRKQGKALRREDFAKMSGTEARKNGRNITDLDKQSWDKDSSTIMKALLKLSFQQNPQALQRLLATGNATLTHTQDKGKWGTEFPRLLMEVRDELRNETQSTQQHDDNQQVQDVKDTVDIRSVDATIQTIEGKKDEFSKEERQSIKSILGDTRPKVLVASEHTDPVWHAKAIKQMVEEELKKPAKDRKFHMMYLITKHDGLPLRELAELKIPKFVHFSITSLGGTKYEPGVMKMDDMLDRIQEFIKEGVLNPNLVTIRIDPIIPGVTTNEDIEHIVQRATAMGIKQFKFSIMDSYGYTATGQRSNNNRYIIPKMEQLGYNWDEYYGKNAAGIVNFDAKPQYMEQIYTFMNGLAQKYNIWFNTCGERPANIPNLTKIRWSMGCVNVQSMNAAMGTTDIANTQGNQRPGCACYGNIVDALEYSDRCASSCVYCYAKHNSDAAVQYYNEDGTLKDNRFTRTSETAPVKQSISELLDRLYSTENTEEKANILDAIYSASNGDFKQLAHKVFSAISKYGIGITTATPSELGAPPGFEESYTVIADFDSASLSIRINTRWEQIVKAAQVQYINVGYTLLHEAIHALTTYAILNKEILSKEAQDAVTVIEACYEKVTNSVDVGLQYFDNNFYGLRNSREIVAELANPEFRKTLRRIKLLDKVIQAVADILKYLFNKDIIKQESSIEDNLLNSLNTLIDKFDINAFNKSNLSHAGLKYIKDNVTPVVISSHTKNAKLLMSDDDVVTLSVSSEERQRILSGVFTNIDGNLIKIQIGGGFGIVKLIEATPDTLTLEKLDSYQIGLVAATKLGLGIIKTQGAQDAIKLINYNNYLLTTEELAGLYQKLVGLDKTGAHLLEIGDKFYLVDNDDKDGIVGNKNRYGFGYIATIYKSTLTQQQIQELQKMTTENTVILQNIRWWANRHKLNLNEITKDPTNVEELKVKDRYVLVKTTNDGQNGPRYKLVSQNYIEDQHRIDWSKLDDQKVQDNLKNRLKSLRKTLDC